MCPVSFRMDKFAENLLEQMMGVLRTLLGESSSSWSLQKSVGNVRKEKVATCAPTQVKSVPLSEAKTTGFIQMRDNNCIMSDIPTYFPAIRTRSKRKREEKRDLQSPADSPAGDRLLFSFFWKITTD